MELRRALLLFAIVLGLAAIVTSFSRPSERDDERASDSTNIRPGPARAGPRRTAPQPLLASFSSTGEPQTERLEVNRPATVTVQTERAGQVELAGLGLVAVAEPLAPARFDLLESRPGSYRVWFTPAGTDESRTVGTLRIRAR